MGKKEDTMGEHGKGVLKGTVFGIILGGLAALLLAPKSGKDTQEALKQRAKQAIKDADTNLSEVEAELGGRIDSLKVAARDLHGEAFEASQRLISRAEIIKNDLKDSADRLATTSKATKPGAARDAKRLVTEGQVVLNELERATRKIIGAAGDTASEDQDADGPQPTV
jgi:gas vesicle protein